VHEDLEHLRGIGDDGDDLHGAVTASATERVSLVFSDGGTRSLLGPGQSAVGLRR
jgi:hypothetical protein